MIPKRPKVKNKDLHIRISEDRQSKLHKICAVTNRTITQIIDEHLDQMEQQYKEIF